MLKNGKNIFSGFLDKFCIFKHTNRLIWENIRKKNEKSYSRGKLGGQLTLRQLLGEGKREKLNISVFFTRHGGKAIICKLQFTNS